MKLSVREYMAPGETLRERMRNLRELGYHGIELVGSYAEEDVPEIKRVMGETGIQVSLVPSGGGCLVDARRDERESALNGLISGLQFASELGAIGVLIPPTIKMKMQIGGPRPPIPDLWPIMSQQEAEKRMVAELLSIAGERAQELGTYVVVEPLNRYEQDWPRTLAEAVELCDTVGNPHIRIMADFFHMSIEEENIPDSIRSVKGYIRNVHIADSTRKTPGHGTTDFEAGIRALKEIAYDDFLCLECATVGNPTEDLKRVARLLKELIEKA